MILDYIGYIMFVIILIMCIVGIGIFLYNVDKENREFKKKLKNKYNRYD